MSPFDLRGFCEVMRWQEIQRIWFFSHVWITKISFFFQHGENLNVDWDSIQTYLFVLLIWFTPLSSAINRPILYMSLNLYSLSLSAIGATPTMSRILLFLILSFLVFSYSYLNILILVTLSLFTCCFPNILSL